MAPAASDAKSLKILIFKSIFLSVRPHRTGGPANCQATRHAVGKFYVFILQGSADSS